MVFAIVVASVGYEIYSYTQADNATPTSMFTTAPDASDLQRLHDYVTLMERERTAERQAFYDLGKRVGYRQGMADALKNNAKVSE
jgi:hypothetical protein